MSKMSEIAMELDDQAIELGFDSYEEAIAKGYEVDYEEGKLVNPYVLDREQEKAHEAWLKERDEVLAELNSLIEMEEFQKKTLGDDYIDTGEMEILNHIVRFIKGVKSE